MRPLKLLLLVLGLLLTGAAASASKSSYTGATLGVYTSTNAGNAVYTTWLNEPEGADKTALARTALRNRVQWFGQWRAAADMPGVIGKYVANVQAGDPTVLATLAVFALWPRGEHAMDCLSAQDMANYRTWVDAVASGIGESRVAVILEPDLPLALKAKCPPRRLALATYAAQTLAALPNTTVYLDAGSQDWLSTDATVDLLTRAGVRYVRGFAYGATHYTSVVSEINGGRNVVRALAASGLPGKRFVVDTADNGRPFTWLQYKRLRDKGWRTGVFDNADTCRSRTQTMCDTLGIPPTTDVTNPAWGLPDTTRTYATNYCDAFLWFGRPWLTNQADPYDKARALAVGRTTPWQ